MLFIFCAKDDGNADATTVGNRDGSLDLEGENDGFRVGMGEEVGASVRVGA